MFKIQAQSNAFMNVIPSPSCRRWHSSQKNPGDKQRGGAAASETGAEYDARQRKGHNLALIIQKYILICIDGLFAWPCLNSIVKYLNLLPIFGNQIFL